jgi:chromosome segregation ATPase
VSRALAFVYSIALGISLFASDMAFQPGALAQAQSAYQEQIASFTSKLETARSTQADFNRRVACLDQRAADLVKQRNNLEVRLGTLRTQEDNLAPQVEKLEAAYKGYMGEYDKERIDLDGFRRRLQELESRKRAQEQAIQECKAKWYTINASCDLAYNILEMAGEIKNYDGDIAAAAKRERIARESANFALEKLQQSRREFDSTRDQANALAAEIPRTEHEISTIKTALSNVRDEVQPYRILIDDFANALTEAKDVNLDDARARTLRTLGDIAAKIDAAVVHSTAAIRQSDGTLGEGWMKSCRVG